MISRRWCVRRLNTKCWIPGDSLNPLEGGLQDKGAIIREDGGDPRDQYCESFRERRVALLGLLKFSSSFSLSLSALGRVPSAQRTTDTRSSRDNKERARDSMFRESRAPRMSCDIDGSASFFRRDILRHILKGRERAALGAARDDTIIYFFKCSVRSGRICHREYGERARARAR